MDLLNRSPVTKWQKIIRYYKLYLIQIQLTCINKLRSIERCCNIGVVPQVPLFVDDHPSRRSVYRGLDFLCHFPMWESANVKISSKLRQQLVRSEFCVHFGADQLGIFWRLLLRLYTGLLCMPKIDSP